MEHDMENIYWATLRTGLQVLIPEDEYYRLLNRKDLASLGVRSVGFGKKPDSTIHVNDVGIVCRKDKDNEPR